MSKEGDTVPNPWARSRDEAPGLQSTRSAGLRRCICDKETGMSDADAKTRQHLNPQNKVRSEASPPRHTHVHRHGQTYSDEGSRASGLKDSGKGLQVAQSCSRSFRFTKTAVSGRGAFLLFLLFLFLSFFPFFLFDGSLTFSFFALPELRSPGSLGSIWEALGPGGFGSMEVAGNTPCVFRPALFSSLVSTFLGVCCPDGLLRSRYLPVFWNQPLDALDWML